MSTTTGESLREQVRERYAEAARQVDGGGSSCGSGSCCADGSPGDFGEALYSAEQRGELPDTAVARVARLRQPDRGRASCTREKPCWISARAAGST